MRAYAWSLALGSAIISARSRGQVTVLKDLDGQVIAEIGPPSDTQAPELDSIPPWHTGPDWSGWRPGPDYARPAGRELPGEHWNAQIAPAPGAAGQSGQELRRGMAEGHPLVAEAARLAGEPAGVRDVVLVHRADLAGFMIWAGYDANDRDPGSTPGRLAQAAFTDPADDLAGLSAYSCQVCGHIAQPEFWHDTGSHTSVPEDQCAHPQAEIDDDGVCQLCDEAVEGPALDAVVLNEIARLLLPAGLPLDQAGQRIREITSLVRWTGRNGGPEPGVKHSVRAGIYEPAGVPVDDDAGQPDTLREMRET